MNKKSFILGLAVWVLFQPLAFAQKVINYDFEDWNGNVDSTPGYVYSSTASSYWDYHKYSTMVKRSTPECGNRAAYSGNFYIHRQFYTGSSDPCLGRTALSINDHGNIGLGGPYPVGVGDKTRLSTAIKSNTLVFRCRFRTTDEWKNQTSVYGYCKFFRLYGIGGGTDPASAIVHLSRANPTNTTFFIYDPSILSYAHFSAGRDLIDGNWHSIGVKVVRNNDINASGNVTVSVWWDDYNLTSNPTATKTITCPEFGGGFQYIQMAQNWSATYPTSLMGIDFDDIEVWDGMPTSGNLSSPTNLYVK